MIRVDRLTVIGWLALIVGSIQATRADDASTTVDSADCGMDALYHLMRLEKRDVPIARIAAAMPRLHPDGYSMKELRDAAASLGLKLDGVNLPRNPEVIDRPMLAFLNLGDRGHYVVIRPIGHTGHLAQVIDEVGEPLVVDSTQLFASPQWTGFVLIPRRTNWLVVVGAGVALFSLIGLALLSWRRSGRDGPPGPARRVDDRHA